MVRPTRKLIGVALAMLALGACSQPAAGPATTPSPSAPSSSQETAPATSSDELVVVTHGSFNLTDELKADFAEESGLDVTYVSPGSSGALVNQLVLTKDSPLGDVVFGIDNTFSGRAVDEEVITPYESPALPDASEQFDHEWLVPIDFSDVCINADLAWFEEQGLAVPTTLDDLTKPEYADLLVVSNPASSSPGLAFLIATVGAYGEDGYLDYWARLRDNGMDVVPDWSDAYYAEFTAAGEGGTRPLVLSYATSPAFTIDEETGESTTVALLGTCFRQVEYAGVIEGAENEAGAQAFIDFLLSDEVQSAIPELMYMYPVATDVDLPAEWVEFAPLSTAPIVVDEETIDAQRSTWIEQWTATVLG